MIIITEKPSVARKISQFLSNNNYKKINFSKRVYYFQFKRDGENFYVVPSIGHLFTISDLNKKFTYPSFDYKWIPAYLEDKIYIKKIYIDMFSRFKNERNIVIATDYDIEGELIGYNILRFIFGRTNAKRMIFSAITYQDIIKSFENLSNINYSFALAGETRHIIDWLYGINLSRALTRAIWHYNRRIYLSIGRVQGPTLRIVYEREKEIQNFIPEEYYSIEVVIKKDNNLLKLKYEKERLKKEEAEEIKRNLGNFIKVINIVSDRYHVSPPHPYNLTDIQTDAYKLYKISPKRTLDILQKLYEKGYISYPRTSSQRLPKTINFREIIENLSEISIYKEFSNILLKKSELIPNNGEKDDVHPAIHPTGVTPSGLNKKEFLIYDLVVRRFLATFMDKALVETYKIVFEKRFYYKFDKILNKGWMIVYWNTLKNNFEDYLFKTGEIYKIEKINIKKKKTKPPPRYNQASLVKKMEELNLGTKSTRAEIVHILLKRGYLTGRSLKITDLGIEVINIFDKYFPEILDINLTRNLEINLEKLERNPDISLKEKIINEVKEIIKNVTSEIKLKEDKIGMELYNKIKESIKKSK